MRLSKLVNFNIIPNKSFLTSFFFPSGGPVPSHRPSEPNPDYVQCPYCKRRFQESAAERHIPFCKEQNARLEHNPASVRAKQSLSKRMQVWLEIII
jgi:hypothetical protein